MSTSVVKWIEGLSNKVCIVTRRYIDHMRFVAYMAVLLITFFSYSFGYILYHCIYGYTLKRAFSYFSFLITLILKLLTNLLGRYARVVDHLAVRDVAQGAPLGGGSTLHPLPKYQIGQEEGQLQNFDCALGMIA